MAIIGDGDWEKAYQEIEDALKDYKNNIQSIIEIYKRIKNILLAHNLEITEENKALSNYPILIDNMLKNLEATIKEYKGYFSEIAEAINDKGGEITSDTPYSEYNIKILALPGGDASLSALSPINSQGYPAGSVVIPKTVINLSQCWAYYPELITELTLQTTLEKLGDYCCYRQNSGTTGCIQLSTLSIPEKVSYIGNYAFYGSTLQSLIFLGSRSNLSIASSAFENNLQLQSINFNGINSLELKDKAFYKNNVLSDINIDGINKIIISTSGYGEQFAYCNITNEKVNQILNKISNSITQSLFMYNKNLTEVTLPLNIQPLTIFGCENLQKIIIAETCSEICTSAFDETILSIENVNFLNENSKILFDFRRYKENNNKLVPTGERFKRKFSTRYRETVYSGSGGNTFVIVDLPKYLNEGYSPSDYNKNMDNQENLASSIGVNFLKKTSYCSNDKIKQFFNHIDEKTVLFGMMNCISTFDINLKIPYSYSLLWCGCDSGNWTSSIETITFERVCSEADAVCQEISIGWGIFSDGFNNTQKIKWNVTAGSINTGIFGRLYRTDSSSIPSEANLYSNSMQSLKEIYFGDGATTIYPCIFMGGDLKYSSYLYYSYLIDSFSRQFPQLKTIRLPGTIIIEQGHCLTPTTSVDGVFTAHALFGGFYTSALPKLTQVILGEGWSLSIELLSTCYLSDIHAKTANYYNLNLDPECMIANIQNVAAIEGGGHTLTITNITNEKLQNYCNVNAGKELIILKNTESQYTTIIPTYAELLSTFENKNWTLAIAEGATAREVDYDEYYVKSN